MLAELPENTRHVIELGGGTGVFTAALLDHGIEPDHLLVLELNEDLHQHLVRRFPQARVVCGDARDLPDIASRIDYGHAGKADAVLSGLGLLSMNRVLQAEIVSAAFAVLRPGGRFIQFTYGPTCPVRREVLAELGLHARRASLTWWNMPPATVYVFERGQSRQVVPTPMHRNGED